MPDEDDEFPEHLWTLLQNGAEIQRLVQIHEKIAGRTPERKRDVEVLNKSGVVLLVACWESFVEDLASEAFDFLLSAAKSPADIPKKVLALAAMDLRSDKDETKVWTLAGSGWRSVLRSHRDRVLAKFTGPFHSPRSEKVDQLFEAVVGIRRISTSWSWPGTTHERVCTKLNALIELRGAIAHRVEAGAAVRKKIVVQH